jgi:hypothetical protein
VTRLVNKPNIRTAIPKRRYRFGEFNFVFLGDIDSGDANQYEYIAAILREGDPEPGIYLTAERNPPSLRDQGRYGMRLIMRDGAQLVRSSDDWRDLDSFVDAVIEVARDLLKLSDEQAFRLP